MPIHKDDRTAAQRVRMTHAVAGTERNARVWRETGQCPVAAWAYDPGAEGAERALLEWMGARSDLVRVRTVNLADWKPRERAHVYAPSLATHPAYASRRRRRRLYGVGRITDAQFHSLEPMPHPTGEATGFEIDGVCHLVNAVPDGTPRDRVWSLRDSGRLTAGIASSAVGYVITRYPRPSHWRYLPA